jgi:hypothetical protein
MMRKHVRTLTSQTIAIVKHLRAKKILTKWNILAVLALCNIFFLTHIFVYTRSLPNTYIGQVPVGLKTREEIKTIVTSLYTKSFSVNVKNHVYDYTYDRLGVYMDPEATIQEIFTPNTQRFPKNFVALLGQLARPRYIRVPLSFSQEFYTFLDKTTYDQSDGPDIVYVDQQEKSISLYERQKKFTLATIPFTQLLTDHFGSPSDTIVAPLIEMTNTTKDKVVQANAQLAFVYSKPLMVIVRAVDGDHFIQLDEQNLKNYTIATVSPETAQVSFHVDIPTLFAHIKLDTTKNKDMQTDSAAKKIANGIEDALSGRLSGDPSESVRIILDDGPSTDGKIAGQYIEVDISQQKMFTFRNNQLYKTYRVSTGKDYPTPTGTFKILNKYNLGYSAIYHVWMPWWMAFAYSGKLHAYFGIHELPYFYVGKNKIQRPREFIGAPNTGGCIALDIGDAKEVYDFAYAGMPVVVNL